MIEILGSIIVTLVGIFWSLLLCILPVAVIGIVVLTALGTINAALGGK
jgi:UPF0716 family protein affecting phage T7 exclusion